MTYAAEIVKIEQPSSAELYRVTTGSVERYYTSYDSVITFGSYEYIPQTMKRSGFILETSLKTVDVTIAVPVAVEFGNVIAAAPYRPTTIRITKVFVTNPDVDYKVIFFGAVSSVNVKNGVASATCRSLSRLLLTKVPRLFYQTNCNHSLFDDGCGLSRITHGIGMNVTIIDENDVTLDGLGRFADGMYLGGTLVFGEEERLITNQVGIKITLLVQFSGLVVGSTVTIYPGCDGYPGTCRGYDNMENFMGMPHIPTKNAILWGFR